MKAWSLFGRSSPGTFKYSKSPSPIMRSILLAIALHCVFPSLIALRRLSFTPAAIFSLLILGIYLSKFIPKACLLYMMLRCDLRWS